ncbi:MAG: LPS assembly protein LptD [Moraxella sp.]|nr:LPS assembly protein LptD [Moraxella sp.]
MTAHALFFYHKKTALATSVQLMLWAVAPVAVAHATNANQSLSTLAQYYQSKPTADARCHGAWVQPTKTPLNTTLTPSSDNAFYAQADYGYWDNKSYAELAGNVVVEQDGQQISADKITYDFAGKQAIAQGQVLFGEYKQEASSTQGLGMIGVAQKLHYHTDGTQALAQDVAFASSSIGAHGYAKQLQKIDQQHYQMQDVMFSTCPPTQQKWHLQADSIDINSDTGRGVAKNSTLKIGKVPVLRLPYFNFPIDDRRASGFLLPKVGFSDNLEVSAPYYLNLAPNYDATLTPTLFANRNPMLTGEFRYLTSRYGSGNLTASFLPQDRRYGDNNRSRVFFNHDWRSKSHPHLHAYATYRYVSDKDYLSDFDSLGLENNPLNLPRRLGGGYYNDYLTADVRAETFQTLGGTNNDGTPIQDKDKPYSRLPQLSINYRLPKVFRQLDKLQITGTHQSAYFKKSIKDDSETEKSGVRMYNQISASYPMLKPWGYITPKLGLAQLYVSYDEDSLAGQNLSKAEGSYLVVAPQISLDTGVFFEKKGSPFGWYDATLGGYQVVSPRLKYNYTPYKNQSKIPNFETAIAAISYDQLLSDSWFLGYDRIQDLHAITPAVSYRYVDKHGLTRFEGSVAEQFFLDDAKVGINDSQVFTGKSSGMAWQASAQPSQSLWIEMAGALTPNYDLNSAVLQLRYQPNNKSLYNFGIIERKAHKATNQQSLSAYTASAVFPINNRWRLLSQAQYDHKNQRWLGALIGVNYEDCCYGVSVYARHYRNDLSPNAKANNAIMAEIRLNGIGGQSNLDRLMNDKVMGYERAKNAWQGNH